MSVQPGLGREREPWAITFGPGTALAGCVVAGVVFMALTFLLLGVVPLEDLTESDEPRSVPRLAMLIGGIAMIGFLLLGPTLGLAVGWLLRRVENHSVHIIGFAFAGALVGGIVGWQIGGFEIANVLAAMVGVSAAAGRTAIRNFVRA